MLRTILRHPSSQASLHRSWTSGLWSTQKSSCDFLHDMHCGLADLGHSQANLACTHNPQFTFLISIVPMTIRTQVTHQALRAACCSWIIPAQEAETPRAYILKRRTPQPLQPIQKHWTHTRAQTSGLLGQECSPFLAKPALL